MGIGLVVVGTWGVAVSVAPPEQAETNMLRISNPATQRFMLGVFHESRSVTQRESRRAPLRLSNIGKPWAADCDTLCHPVPVAKPESTGRPEISGLSSIICLVELGGIETQKSVQDVRLDRSCLWNQGCVSDGYACVRVVLCILCNEVCNA